MTTNAQLADSLEALRRTVCGYSGQDTCDCKYGVGEPGSEHTGCPELRDAIRRLRFLPATQSDADGTWMSYYSDGSGFTVFATEIDALRHAVEWGRQVKFVKWGENL